MGFINRYMRKWTGLFLIVTLICQLSAPAVIYANDSAKASSATERMDKKALTKIGGRIEVILNNLCEKISENPDNDVKLNTYLIDDKHRIFADIEGSIVIRFPSIIKKSIKKFQDAVGQCLSTNGPLSLDFAVHGFDKIDEKTYKLTFQADIVMPLKEVLRHMFIGVLDIFGTITIGASVAKAATFLDSLDTERLAFAIGDGLKKLWALGAGEIAMETYREFDETGGVDLKSLLTTTLTVKSVIYHFGAFIICAGVRAGESLATLSFGAALGTSMAGQIGAFVGAALAAVTTAIIGTIIVEQLTIILPMAYKLRKIRKLQDKIEICGNKDTIEADMIKIQSIAKLEETEISVIEFLADEITLDRYEAFSVFVEKMEKINNKGRTHYYTRVLKAAKQQLKLAAIYDENWNAARHYYQLLEALDELPAESTN